MPLTGAVCSMDLRISPLSLHFSPENKKPDLIEV